MLTILCKLDYNENPCLSLGNIKKRCVHHLMSHFCKFGWVFFSSGFEEVDAYVIESMNMVLTTSYVRRHNDPHPYKNL